jgi:O-antigen ligase
VNRVFDLLQRYPVEITISASLGLAAFFAAMWVLRIRFGFPVVAFACLFLLMAGVTSWTQLQVFSKGFLRWAALALMAASAVVYARGLGLPRNRWTSVHWGWVALLAIAFGLAPFGVNPKFAAMSAAAVTMLFVASFVTIWCFASTPQRLVEMADVLFKLGAVVTAAGFAFVILPGASAFAESRFQGFFNNPNWNGNLSAILLPVALWKARYPRNRMEGRIAVGVALAFAANMLLSGSRGAIVGGFVMGAAAQLRLDRARFFRSLLFLVPLIALALLTQAGRSALETRAERLARMERVGTLTHRTEMWREAWPQVVRHLRLGMGLGNSRFILMSEEEEEAAAKVGATAANLHSQHLLMIAELGVLGLALLWLFFVRVGISGVRMWALPKRPLADLCFALCCSCGVVFGDSFLHGWMLSAGSAFALLFWTIAALMLKSERFALMEAHV